MTATDAAADTGRQGAWNAFVLSAALAVNGAMVPITVTLGGLVGLYLLGDDKTLATLPVTAGSVGTALGAIPAAALARRLGRQLGFISGASVGLVGGLISAAAIVMGSFWLFILGAAAIGFAAAFSQQYRFAAADTGTEAFRAKAISWVMAGGVLSAVIGPQTVIHARDLLAPIPFAGAFLGASGLAVIGMLILSLLRGPARHPPQVAAGHAGDIRPLSAIAAQPRFVVAVICAIGSFGLMSLVMTAAPLAMIGCGLTQDSAALGIQWHILAMYLPSFFTGSIIGRFGAEKVVAAGMAILVVCAAIGLSGVDLVHFWLGLVLLGLGWNFGFVGATAMLTSTYRPAERARVQGFNDFLVFGAVAISSFSSGKLLTAAGWTTINIIVFPVVALCLLALAWLAFAGAKKAP